MLLTEISTVFVDILNKSLTFNVIAI